jgi:hypothetical protein
MKQKTTLSDMRKGQRGTGYALSLSLSKNGKVVGFKSNEM